jgi:hypothetical protein
MDKLNGMEALIRRASTLLSFGMPPREALDMILEDSCVDIQQAQLAVMAGMVLSGVEKSGDPGNTEGGGTDHDDLPDQVDRLQREPDPRHE